MRFRGAIALAITWMLAVTAARAENIGTPAPHFSVLTPSVSGQYFVSTQFNLNTVYPLLGLPGDIMNRSRTKQLRGLVEANSYDPAPALTERLIAALGRAGYGAVHERIPRRPAGSVQSLSWSDLPEQPKGRMFLDLDVRWLCLCSSTSYMKQFPGISLSWRVLEPGQKVAVPSRGLVYYHIPWDPPDTGRRPAARAPAEPSPYPPATVSESCGFSSLDEAEKDAARLWRCFAEAYDVAVERLVTDLRRLMPPSAITVSAYTQSGKSMR